MLDPWIIEQIRRREQERSRPQPGLEMPLPEDTPWSYPDESSTGSEKGTERGVAIISI